MSLRNQLVFQFIRHPRLRRWVTALLERDRNSDVYVAGTKLHINHRREHGYLRASRLIQRNGTLRDEVPILMSLFAILRDGDTFVDVGANIGLYTHSVRRLQNIYSNLHIVSVEAHPDTFKRLSVHPYPRVTFHNVAAGDEEAELTFVDGAVSHVFTRVEEANHYNITSETTRVKTVRLDSLEFPTPSLVLKIDVEGQERAVLDGASALFESNRIKAVYLDGFKDDSIIDLLKGYGFELREGRRLMPADKKIFSLLAIKKSMLT